jgi:hypothetical protein
MSLGGDRNSPLFASGNYPVEILLVRACRQTLLKGRGKPLASGTGG